jgi:hypothetical protein
MRGVEKIMNWSIIGCITLALYEGYRTYKENYEDEDYGLEDDSTDDGDDPTGDGGETIIEL